MKCIWLDQSNGFPIGLLCYLFTLKPLAQKFCVYLGVGSQQEQYSAWQICFINFQPLSGPEAEIVGTVWSCSLGRSALWIINLCKGPCLENLMISHSEVAQMKRNHQIFRENIHWIHMEGKAPCNRLMMAAVLDFLLGLCDLNRAPTTV